VSVEVLGPLGEAGASSVGQAGGVAFGAGYGVDEDQHVAGLFDGHLVFFGFFSPPPVDLPGWRVGTGRDRVWGRRGTSSGRGKSIRGRGGVGLRGSFGLKKRKNGAEG